MPNKKKVTLGCDYAIQWEKLKKKLLRKRKNVCTQQTLPAILLRNLRWSRNIVSQCAHTLLNMATCLLIMARRYVSSGVLLLLITFFAMSSTPHSSAWLPNPASPDLFLMYPMFTEYRSVAQISESFNISWCWRIDNINFKVCVAPNCLLVYS